MNKRLITSAKGVSLVELLVALALFGMISVLVVSVLSGGMKSFKNINDDVSLHDEANAIMTSFANEIFVATSVSKIADSSNEIKIEIKKYKGTGEGEETITLGFENGNAVIEGNQINSTFITVDVPRSKIEVNDDTIQIQLTIKSTNEKELTLTSEVSYVNIDET